MVVFVVGSYGGMSKKTNSMYHAVQFRYPFTGNQNYGHIVNTKFLDTPFRGDIDKYYDMTFDSSGRIVDYKLFVDSKNEPAVSSAGNKK